MFDINLDVDNLLRLLASWTRNKEKGMTLNKYHKDVKKKYPDMPRNIFVQFIRDQQRAGRIKVYRDVKTKKQYVVISNY
ncbi:MAG: hypothetical protein WA139_02435 [Candidatus Aenigmatarchaeota archaeon]